MKKAKYEEGDIVLTVSGKIAEITAVEILEDVFYRLYLPEDERNSMLLQKYIDKPITDCDVHDDFVYHNKKDSWVCPFCEI